MQPLCDPMASQQRPVNLDMQSEASAVYEEQLHIQIGCCGGVNNLNRVTVTI